MRVSVYPGGRVRVTVPRRASASAIDRFLARYSAWIQRAQEKFKDTVVITAEKRHIGEYKQRAAKLVEAQAAHYAARFGVQYRRITIRAQKRRWGSCSRAGNLSFNYKIALLSKRLQNYIIVHEICHLLQFDHSRAFWEHVAHEVPDHQVLRAELRRIHFRFR